MPSTSSHPAQKSLQAMEIGTSHSWLLAVGRLGQQQHSQGVKGGRTGWCQDPGHRGEDVLIPWEGGTKHHVGDHNPSRKGESTQVFIAGERVFGATPLSRHYCTLQNKELRLLILGFSFCPSCLQHDQLFPRHVWEWQALTSTPDCPGLSAADTGLPFGHNSSSHGFFLPGIRALWSELLLQCLHTGPGQPHQYQG